MVNHVVTSVLDAIGILALATGVSAAVFPLIDWASIGIGGGTVLLCSWLVSREWKADNEEQAE